MARLPTPGSDDNAWGGILNDFLTQAHNADGTLKNTGLLADKASDTAVVHKAGTETISGDKDFTGALTHASNAVVDTTDSRLSNARTPTGTAGGVLSGTYPNPGFAVDMATQAELDIIDTASAKKASNLSDLTNATTARTNLGLGNIDNTSDAAKNSATVTLTNKTITDNGSNVRANSLKSATTTVDVAAATAPSAGQVLTASSGTAATWTTPTITVPGGSDKQLQYNNAGAFAGAAFATVDTTNQSLIVGSGTPFNNTVKLQIGGSANTTTQANIQNTNAGTSASSDWVATADTGSDTANYIDLGINSSTYADAAYTISGPLDSYLYANGGNLTIGTQTAAKDIVFHAGGTLAANEVMRVKATGITNTRITKRSVVLTDGATITPNSDTTDLATVTIAASRTMVAPTGTPANGQQLMLRVTQGGVGSFTITWNAIYRFSTDVPNPTLSTAAGKTDYIGFQYNTASTTWDCLAVARGY